MSDFASGRIGYVIGQLAVMSAISVVTLYLNRERRANPTPYLAAGAICATLTLVTVGEDSGLTYFSTFIVWLALLWRFKIEARVPATGLARVNAIYLALLLVFAALSIGDQYGVTTTQTVSALGMASIVAGLLWKWVRLVPLKK